MKLLDYQTDTSMFEELGYNKLFENKKYLILEDDNINITIEKSSDNVTFRDKNNTITIECETMDAIEKYKKKVEESFNG